MVALVLTTLHRHPGPYLDKPIPEHWKTYLCEQGVDMNLPAVSCIGEQLAICNP